VHSVARSEISHRRRRTGEQPAQRVHESLFVEYLYTVYERYLASEMVVQADPLSWEKHMNGSPVDTAELAMRVSFVPRNRLDCI
jgi:hypothetical protein